MQVASSIFTTFVFRKLLPDEQMPMLVPPLPSQIYTNMPQGHEHPHHMQQDHMPQGHIHQDHPPHLTDFQPVNDQPHPVELHPPPQVRVAISVLGRKSSVTHTHTNTHTHIYTHTCKAFCIVICAGMTFATPLISPDSSFHSLWCRSLSILGFSGGWLFTACKDLPICTTCFAQSPDNLHSTLQHTRNLHSYTSDLPPYFTQPTHPALFKPPTLLLFQEKTLHNVHPTLLYAAFRLASHNLHTQPCPNHPPCCFL